MAGMTVDKRVVQSYAVGWLAGRLTGQAVVPHSAHWDVNRVGLQTRKRLFDQRVSGSSQ